MSERRWSSFFSSVVLFPLGLHHFTTLRRLLEDNAGHVMPVTD